MHIRPSAGPEPFAPDHYGAAGGRSERAPRPLPAPDAPAPGTRQPLWFAMIPQEQAETELTLRGTAGLRLLPKAQSDAILAVSPAQRACGPPRRCCALFGRGASGSCTAGRDA